MTDAARIVVVDDAEFSRRFLSRLLAGEGYEVAAEGTDGHEAVELFEKHRPHLMTLDLVMPGMDGITALERIRDGHPEARIIVVSSLAEEEVLLKALRLGASDFVTKPVEPERFLDAVRKALLRE